MHSLSNAQIESICDAMCQNLKTVCQNLDVDGNDQNSDNVDGNDQNSDNVDGSDHDGLTISPGFAPRTYEEWLRGPPRILAPQDSPYRPPDRYSTTDYMRQCRSVRAILYMLIHRNLDHLLSDGRLTGSPEINEVRDWLRELTKPFGMTKGYISDILRDIIGILRRHVKIFDTEDAICDMIRYEATIIEDCLEDLAYQWSRWPRDQTVMH
jgi:hypothetical protein